MAEIYDLIIVGGGPAGLSAAIYMARARYSVLIIERDRIGGQIAITEEVANYPGVAITDGQKLTATMKNQAESFGAEILMANVTGLNASDTVKEVVTNNGTYKALSVLLATGASPKKLGFIGEEEFKGRGIAYCATCDGEFFTDKDIFVIGGGLAAVEEAMFLTKYGKSVNILVRRDVFNCPQSILDELYGINELKNYPKIKIHFNTEVKEVGGDSFLQYAKFINNKTNEEWEYRALDGDTFGIFVLAGRTPENSLAFDIIELDENGYIITDSSQKTNIDGVYAAGDICVKDLRQVVTAVSDGAIASTAIEKYTAALHKNLKIETKTLNKRNKINRAEQKEESNDLTQESENGFFTNEMKKQLTKLLENFRKEITLKLFLDDRKISAQVEAFAKEITDLSDTLKYEIVSEEKKDTECPSIELWTKEGFSGLAFHGVPGGHEFNSFVIALYNVAGAGQKIDDATNARIKKIDKNIQIKIIISLSCTMCPELVMAAQKIASQNCNVSAEVFDIAHFSDYQSKYKIMSVPCMIINDSEVVFGRKNIDEVLDILDNIENL